MQLEQLLEESTRNKLHVHTVEAMRVELLSRSDALQAAQRDTDAKRQETERLMAEFRAHHEERGAERERERERERELERERQLVRVTKEACEREKLELEREREALAKERGQYQKNTDAEREREEEREKERSKSNELEQKNEALKMVIEKKTLQVKSAQIPPSCTQFQRPIS